MTYTNMTQIPNNCPYTIRTLHKSITTHTSTYLIREHDEFGEYPNIFVKVYYDSSSSTNLQSKPVVLILSDSGTGLNTTVTEALNLDTSNKAKNNSKKSTSQLKGSQEWNIATFLELTLNPSHEAPYIILTTHCHCDHICGIQHLQDAKANVRVVSSSHDKSYLTPWENLQRHSLCASNGMEAPRYKIHWIGDGEKVKYRSGMGGDSSDGGEWKDSSIIVFHTPGHTADSLSWYDRETNVLSVGDMFYERESDETRSGSNGQWKTEPPMPVIFEGRSDISDWSTSMHRLLEFVRLENKRLEVERHGKFEDGFNQRYRQDGRGVGVEFNETTIGDDEWELVTTVSVPSRVVLCAAHVTVVLDAETALLDMISFMFRIQLDQVPRTKVTDPEGKDDVWLWDDCLSKRETSGRGSCMSCNYSVRAPWSTIHPKVD